jgi:hypothetical protein
MIWRVYIKQGIISYIAMKPFVRIEHTKDLASRIDGLTEVVAKQGTVMLHTVKSVDAQGASIAKNLSALVTRVDGVERLHIVDIEAQTMQTATLTQRADAVGSAITELRERCDYLSAHNQLVARALVAAAVYPTALAAALFIYFSVY